MPHGKRPARRRTRDNAPKSAHQPSPSATPPVCGWFARCGRPAAGTTPHRILGLVLICEPCATMFDLPVTP